MSHRRTRLAVASVLLLALAGACSTSDPTPSVSATATATSMGSADDQKVLDGITVTDTPVSSSGAPGSTAGTAAPTAPTITLSTKPVSVSTTARRILIPGSGPLSTKDSVVKTELTLVLGSDGKQVDTTYGQGGAQSFSLSDTTTIKGLIAGLTGVQRGSRVLLVIPPAEAFGPSGRTDLGVLGTDNLVLLADVTAVTTPLKQAEGAEVPPVAGLPTVTFDPAKGPTITVPSATTPPADTVVQPLVKGSGAVVTTGQAVLVHYTGVLWKDGSVFDSSWTRGAPFTLTAGQGQVIKAWDTALVGATVGSRLLIVVPPKDGYGDAGSPPKISGTDTMVFVVDVLGVS